MNGIRDSRSNRWRVSRLVAIAALALLATGCGRESSPARPLVETVVVQGRIGAVPPGHDLEVEFRRFDTSGATFTTEADATGSYRAELPVGDYRARVRGTLGSWLYIARSGGTTTATAEAETLRLRPGDSPWRRDFGLGALRLVVEGLEEFEGWTGYVHLYRVQADTVAAWSWGSFGAEVNGGILELHTPPFQPGAWQLKLSFRRDGATGGYTEQHWCASQGPAFTPDRLRVAPDSLTTHQPTLPPPAILAGRITGPWQEMGGRPPGMLAMGTDGLHASTLNEVQADGSFRLVLPRARPVRINVGDGPGVWIGGDDEQSATVFDPEPAEVVGGITGAVAGLVVRPTWTVPLRPSEGYYVELHEPQESLPVRSVWAMGGRWARIADLRPGEYQVRIVSDPRYCLWRSQWFDRAETAATALTIVAPADGGFTVIDPVLERGGVISGSVEIAGLTNCTVFITRIDAPVVVGYVDVDDEEPAFEFTGLEDGRYRLGLYCGFEWFWLGASAPAGSTWYPGVEEWGAAGDLEIANASTIDSLVVPSKLCPPAIGARAGDTTRPSTPRTSTHAPAAEPAPASAPAPSSTPANAPATPSASRTSAAPIRH